MENAPLTRRDFIQRSALGAAALSFGKMPDIFKTQPMGIVVHSYASRWNAKQPSTKYPGFTNAAELMEHCHSIGAGGVQTTIRDWTPEIARKLRDQKEKWGMYLEGSIGLPRNADEVPRFEQEVKTGIEAGVTIFRTVCMNGRRYENFHSPEAIQEFKKNSVASLHLAEPIVRKQGVKLAVENHKDWRADELAALIKALGSDHVGVTLDFGNSIALLEDPMEVVNTLAPYVLSTHVKDMGVREYEDGFLLSEVPLGEGILDLPKIVAICKKYNPNVNFSLEMITRDPLQIPILTKEYWPAMEVVPAEDVAETLRMVRQKKFKTDLPTVAQLSADARLAVEEQNILESLAYSKKLL
ncbi:sugar phosphate isomerase/epimerase family protein [Salmonirosea aquatica]|uniref:TIM barrel protein n=1 Tax=Salmonirosea aquatica TaxID=2654236 RepID=A0A7C9FZQ6_9BACT|nr:TIM barrel protein [Cytophagaceae bacterium SJW1-29]